MQASYLHEKRTDPSFTAGMSHVSCPFEPHGPVRVAGALPVAGG